MIGANDSSAIDDILRGLGRSRRTALQVPTFASVANLIRGTDIIATLPSRLAGSMMEGSGSSICRLISRNTALPNTGTSATPQMPPINGLEARFFGYHGGWGRVVSIVL